MFMEINGKHVWQYICERSNVKDVFFSELPVAPTHRRCAQEASYSVWIQKSQQWLTITVSDKKIQTYRT